MPVVIPQDTNNLLRSRLDETATTLISSDRVPVEKLRNRGITLCVDLVNHPTGWFIYRVRRGQLSSSECITSLRLRRKLIKKTGVSRSRLVGILRKIGQDRDQQSMTDVDFFTPA